MRFFSVSDKVIQSRGVQESLESAMIEEIGDGKWDHVKADMKFFSSSKESEQRVGEQGLLKAIANGWFHDTHQIVSAFNLPKDVCKSPEFFQAAEKGIFERLNSKVPTIEDLKEVRNFIENYSIPLEMYQGALRSFITKFLSGGSVLSIPHLVEIFDLPRSIEEFEPYLDPAQKSLIPVFSLKTVDDLLNLDRDFLTYISRHPGTEAALEAKDLPFIKKHHLRLKEAEEIKRFWNEHGYSEKVETEDMFKKTLESGDLAGNFSTSCEEWNDSENIINPFRKGAEIFGAERMMSYLDRPSLTRHDGLHAFSDIIELYELSGLSADEFY